MKIHPKSYPVITSVVLFLICVLVNNCTSSPSTNDYVASGPEVSLAEDRKELEELRKDVPEEKQKQNDELAFLLKHMQSKPDQIELSPSEISQRYHRDVRRKRETFQKALRAEREKFNKQEREEREKILKDLKNERESFHKAKRDQDERRRFNSEQSSKRERFFADSRERRMSFEEQMRTRQKDFDHEVRAQEAEFKQLLKEYEKSYRDRKALNAKAKKPSSPEAVPLETKNLEAKEQ